MIRRVLSIWLVLACAAPTLVEASASRCGHTLAPCCRQHRAQPNTLRAASCCQLERAERAPAPVAVQQVGPELWAPIALALPHGGSWAPRPLSPPRWITAETPQVRPKRFLALRQLLI